MENIYIIYVMTIKVRIRRYFGETWDNREYCCHVPIIIIIIISERIKYKSRNLMVECKSITTKGIVDN